MILRIEDLKEKCAAVLQAVDNSDPTAITETLELKTLKGKLYLNVTNREYYVSVRLDVDMVEDFHATVNANLFLKLIAKTTADTVELSIKDNALVVRGNGVYKLPLIYEEDHLLELPSITIEEPSVTFPMSVDILKNILNYNSREINRNIGARHPVQNYYYLDEKGCITFTTSACITNFNLEKPVKVLLTNKIVRLFKLFTEDVTFSLGHSLSSSGMVRTKVSFTSPDISLVSFTNNDESLINVVPVDLLRSTAGTTYPHTAVVNRSTLLAAINRLMLFLATTERTVCSDVTFTEDQCILRTEGGVESLYWDNDISTMIDSEYTTKLNLFDLKIVLESCVEQHVSLGFGNQTSISLYRPNVVNVIPEIRGAE